MSMAACQKSKKLKRGQYMTSDVLGWAGLESLGLGQAFVGLGLKGLQAQPKPTCILILMFLPV